MDSGKVLFSIAKNMFGGIFYKFDYMEAIWNNSYSNFPIKNWVKMNWSHLCCQLCVKWRPQWTHCDDMQTVVGSKYLELSPECVPLNALYFNGH